MFDSSDTCSISEVHPPHPGEGWHTGRGSDTGVWRWSGRSWRRKEFVRWRHLLASMRSMRSSCICQLDLNFVPFRQHPADDGEDVLKVCLAKKSPSWPIPWWQLLEGMVTCYSSFIGWTMWTSQTVQLHISVFTRHAFQWHGNPFNARAGRWWCWG